MADLMKEIDVSNRICSVKECGKQTRTGKSEFCDNHYRRWLRENHQTRCSIEGCERAHFGKGLCGRHYQRMRSTGTVDLINRDRFCSVEDCDRKHSGLGYCLMHYTRFIRHGDPHIVAAPNIGEGEGHHLWIGDAISYNGMHFRIRKARGSAAEQDCVDCSGQAAQWSYNNSGVDESIENGLRYSTDVMQYSPRCVPCHVDFDLSERLVSA